MKNLYYYFLIIVFSFSAMYCSDSQNFQGRMNPSDRAAQLKERLNLTDEQTKNVEQIYQESADRLSEMRDQFSDRSQMREQMMKSREELNNKIEGILNNDQIELYREFQNEQEQLRRGRRGQRQEQD